MHGGGPRAPSRATARSHSGAAADYLLRLDDLTLPGFTTVNPPGAIDAISIAAGDGAVGSALAGAGVRSAASARYFRTVDRLATADGPIDVTTTVITCAGAAGASSVRDALAAHLDSVARATPTSTGPLADGGHGDVIEVADQGVTVAQATLVWRATDLVSILVVRERDTGSPLQDALIVAAPQVARQTR